MGLQKKKRNLWHDLLTLQFLAENRNILCTYLSDVSNVDGEIRVATITIRFYSLKGEFPPDIISLEIVSS
jgi:hypothetical protein